MEPHTNPSDPASRDSKRTFSHQASLVLAVVGIGFIVAGLLPGGGKLLTVLAVLTGLGLLAEGIREWRNPGRWHHAYVGHAGTVKPAHVHHGHSFYAKIVAAGVIGTSVLFVVLALVYGT